MLNKAQKWVFQALLLIRSWLPFALCSRHTDSGSEFSNHHLHRYCYQQRIGLTRSRPNRKLDNNFTEQKNNDVMHRYVGYLRLQTEQEVALLNQLYDRLRLLVNLHDAPRRAGAAGLRRTSDMRCMIQSILTPSRATR